MVIIFQVILSTTCRARATFAEWLNWIILARSLTGFAPLSLVQKKLNVAWFSSFPTPCANDSFGIKNEL